MAGNLRRFLTCGLGSTPSAPVRSLGLAPTALYAGQKLRFRYGPPRTAFVWLLSKQARYPLRCRQGPATSTCSQIFRDLEYRCLDDARDVRLLARSGFDRISILKVDIEGAELTTFGVEL